MRPTAQHRRILGRKIFSLDRHPREIVENLSLCSRTEGRTHRRPKQTALLCRYGCYSSAFCLFAYLLLLKILEPGRDDEPWWPGRVGDHPRRAGKAHGEGGGPSETSRLRGKFLHCSSVVVECLPVKVILTEFWRFPNITQQFASQPPKAQRCCV